MKDYREKARRYLQMAAESRDPEIAQLLRLLAADCLQLAQGSEGQQQQQIQPKPDDSKENT